MTTTQLGEDLSHYSPPPIPDGSALEGRYARLERLSERHGPPLYQAFAGAPEVWDYMPVGPFTEAEFAAFVAREALVPDPMLFAIYDHDTQSFGGFASFLRINPESGSIELGYIALSPGLQKTRAATEALYLFMKWSFEAGYRRFEWKCNAENIPSRRAAQRLGLSYEGVFRQATIVKGRNRDTAWFAAIDKEWPVLRAGFDAWLDPVNFDERGQQRTPLGHWTSPVLVARDPALD